MFCPNQEDKIVLLLFSELAEQISGSQPIQNTLINKESLVKFWLNYVELQ